MLFLRNFHRNSPTVFAGQFAAARQAFIGAFERLDSKHCPGFHNNRLANLQP